MNYRPYPDVDRAVAQLKRRREPESPVVAWIDEHLLPGLGLEGWQKDIVTQVAKQTRKAALVAAVVDQAVKAGEHVHVATRDGARCAGGDDACPLPETAPAALRPARHCPGFPTRCPNLRPVAPDPPNHYGGTRCGCGDDDSGTVKGTKAAEDLVAFIRARLDEDEAAARAAAEPEQWMELNRQPRPRWYVQYWADPDQAAVIADPESSAYPVVVTPAGMAEADAEWRVRHIVRHDPERVLRQTAILRDWVDLWSRMVGTHARACLRAVAAIWADHPDYRKEWAL